MTARMPCEKLLTEGGPFGFSVTGLSTFTTSESKRFQNAFHVLAHVLDGVF